MSDNSNSMETVSFRRFLSYIYAYEDDTKLRNVGFAKVEVRSGRVRFQVIVNGIFQKGGRPLDFCLVDRNRNRIPVGQVMLQNGRGEYRGSSSTENLWDSGISFSQIYGICLQGAGNRRHYYMTLWREIPRPDRVSHNQIVVIPRTQEEQNENGIHAAEVQSEKAEIEDAVEAESIKIVDSSQVEVTEEIAEKKEILEAEEVTEIESVSVETEESELREMPTADEILEKEDLPAANNILEKEDLSVPEDLSEKEEIVSAEAISEDFQEQLNSASELIAHHSAGKSVDMGASVKKYQQNQKIRKEDKRMELWKRFCSRYPHVDIRPEHVDDKSFGDGFSENGRICEVLRIRPNDIGRLPRNNWILAHNSFLQHAYNHSRQLILFRVENGKAENGEPEFAEDIRWFIGLPGEKTEQETLVAEVFGFKKFLKCKNGGFWYTEVYMGAY